MPRPSVPFATPLAAAACAVALGLSSCTDVAGPPTAITSLPRDLSAAEREVIASSNSFAFELLRRVQAGETDAPNVFLSPLSASMALGMALNGADGVAYDGMRDALGFHGLTEEAINAGYRDLIDLLLDLDPGVEMALANSIWARLGIPFHQAFFDRATSYFDAEVRELDFDDPAAKDVINAWVEEKTNGRIESIVKEIKPTDAMFLLNAVYFKGSWTTRFDAAKTGAAPFFLDGGGSVQVEMMRGKVAGGLAWRPDVVIGELPYGGQAFVMTVVVPRDDRTLAELVESLDAARWADWTGAVADYDDELPVTLPRFELEYEKLLNDVLIAMGMERAFERGYQNFPRLTPMPESWIDRVVQKTFLKVDEEGTEAAAVTSVVIGVESAPAGLDVDRPFLFAIRERLTGAILFLGAIGDPSA